MDACRFTPNPNLGNFFLSEAQLMEGLESSPFLARELGWAHFTGTGL